MVRLAAMSFSAGDGETGLESVIDDHTPRRDAVEWAVAELAGGRGFEEVGAGLVEAGWAAEQSAEILEEARRRTRELRGAVTRDEVALAAERRYRQGMRAGWFVGMPMAAAAARLLHS